MAILTKEQKEKYLKNGTNLCPFCESSDIVGGSVEIDGAVAWQEVSCSECGEVWQDVYKFAFVETQEELNARS
jgi:transcription elongation factor Elf1